MADIGFTHIALPVTDLDASIAFYAKYARMKVVHRRALRVDPAREVAWLSDGTRPFALVLAEYVTVDRPLGPFAHLGVACESRAELDGLCALARAEGCLRDGPYDSGPPVGYVANLDDPDGHTLELSFGQDVALTVEGAAKTEG